jgi:hypothetical protein
VPYLLYALILLIRPYVVSNVLTQPQSIPLGWKVRVFGKMRINGHQHLFQIPAADFDIPTGEWIYSHCIYSHHPAEALKGWILLRPVTVPPQSLVG